MGTLKREGGFGGFVLNPCTHEVVCVKREVVQVLGFAVGHHSLMTVWHFTNADLP